MVMPVILSPLNIEWGMGAGPLKFGKRLGWTLIIPLFFKETNNWDKGMN